MADRSRSRIPVASARYPGVEHQEIARSLKEPAARSLEYWARTRGEEPALFERGSVMTYAEWNENADLLADGLASRGLGPGDVIAVRCHNRLEWAVIALAASKIDAPLLTLDPDLAGRAVRERLIAANASAIIIGDTDPGAISTSLLGLPFRLRATMDVARPGFFNFWDLIPPAAPARFGWAAPSLIAWSGGTAGQPQCVEIPGQRTAPASISRPPELDAGVSLITVPLYRAWGTTQFWGALAAGHTIALMREFDPVEALDVIEQRRVTHWAAWPDMFRQILDLPASMLAAANRSSLRDLVIGGAPAPWTLKAQIAATFGPILSEAYGATETGVITLMPAPTRHERPSSCGRPVRGAVVEIRDSEGRKLPCGAIGEIWVRTPRTLACQMKGRRQRNLRDGEGFIATGDVGKLDADGYLYISDRKPDPGGELRYAG